MGGGGWGGMREGILSQEEGKPGWGFEVGLC